LLKKSSHGRCGVKSSNRPREILPISWTNNRFPDFAEVTPVLYRGAQPRKHGLEALAKMGMQIVVDLRGDRRAERKEVNRLGMQYIPMHWQCSFPKDPLALAPYSK
jgi:hypothetical protein